MGGGAGGGEGRGLDLQRPSKPHVLLFLQAPIAHLPGCPSAFLCLPALRGVPLTFARGRARMLAQSAPDAAAVHACCRRTSLP